MNSQPETVSGPECRRTPAFGWRLCAAVLAVAVAAGLAGGILGHQLSARAGNNTHKTLEQEVAELRATAQAALRTAEAAMEAAGTIRGSRAVIDLSSPGGYSFLNTQNGVFYVALREAVPYLDGYKLILDVGNPSYATYNGFELTAEWPVALLGSGSPGSKRQTKTRSYSGDLRAGSWNRVEFIVSPFDNPRDLIGLTMTTNQVSLIKPLD